MENAESENKEQMTCGLLEPIEEWHSTPQDFSGNRIIIVEDDQAILKCLQTYLIQEGYEVTAVSSAHQFYQHIFSDSYALAILDIGLPDQSGLVLTEYARKNTEMRIIIYTGQAAIEDLLSGQKAGADLYLVKPVDFRQLSASIATLLSRMAPPSTPPPLPGQKLPPPAQQSWKLISSRWVLQTPHEKEIKLTNKEFDFIAEFTTSQNALVQRTELLNKLGYLNNHSGYHSLQSLVNRLRTKIELHNGQSPIKASHGIGYTFMGDITAE